MIQKLSHSEREARRERRRLRFRRHGRRAYIRSVYTLPSLATLGNAICGFGAMYIAGMDTAAAGSDPWAIRLASSRFAAACYLIFLAMLFDAIDGRLARFARHTTDFGGQLDSLADVVSFGAAPAFIALQAFKSYAAHTYAFEIPFFVSRLIWAIGALYFSCAAIRLARFNVSNEHGEQHHFSFLGLPSPGAGGAVVALVLMQHELFTLASSTGSKILNVLHLIAVTLIPVIVLATGLLMVSEIRYPHVINRYLRGKRSIPQLLVMLTLVLMLVVAHQYTIGVSALVYVAWGPLLWLLHWYRKAPVKLPLPPAPPAA